MSALPQPDWEKIRLYIAGTQLERSFHSILIERDELRQTLEQACEIIGYIGTLDTDEIGFIRRAEAVEKKARAVLAQSL